MSTQPYQLPDIASAAARYAQRGAAAVGRGLGAAGRWAFRHTPVGGLMEDEPGIMPALRTGVSSLTPQAAPRPEPVSIEGHADRLMDSQQSSNDPMDSALQRFSASPETSRQVLAGGDFRSMQPDWGTDVSASQLAIDDDARSDIMERHARRLREIQEEEDLRGDPMDDAISRQRQTLEYERNLPYGSRPHVRANLSGGRQLRDVQLEDNNQQPNLPGALTVGEGLEIERAQARLAMSPQGRQMELSAIEAAKLRRVKGHLEQLLSTGAIAPAMAEQEMNRAFAESAKRGALMEGDYRSMAALLYPRQNEDDRIAEMERR